MSLATLQKPFARWENFAECKKEQMQIGHSEESAGAICATIQERAEKGTLFKGVESLEFLKGVGEDLVVGGIVSWELVDPENDYVTTEAMVNFLRKFFALPEEYRNITIDHTNFQIGKALLQYPEEEPRYFSHVHEKGLYGIALIRNDNLARTRHYRKKILNREYKMFSISGEPVKLEKVLEGNKVIRKIYDIDPFEWAIVKEGYNPKAEFDILKSKCPPCIEHLKKRYMNKGFNEATALEMAEKLFKRVYERMEKERMHKRDLQKPEDERPPKAWWDACIASVSGADPAAVCGHIFHHALGGSRARADPSMFEKKLLNVEQITKDMTWEQCLAAARKNPKVTDPEKLCGWLRYYGPHGEKKSRRLEKSRDLTFHSEAERVFRKYFPNYERCDT